MEEACEIKIDISRIHFKIYIGWGGWFLGSMETEGYGASMSGYRCINDILMIQLNV
jgi:hypothetical protein